MDQLDIYLPIAERSENVLVLLAIGGAVGFLSGVFGVGGGFLLTPFLLFLGIPAPVAVASGANQVVGASASAVLGHWRRGNVDLKLGAVMMAGGIAGSVLGVLVFRLLRTLGHLDIAIAISYVLLLGTIGVLMLAEGTRAIWQRRRAGRGGRTRGPRRYTWINALPLKTRFRRSRLYISGLIPVGIGFVVGVLSSVLGVGGGFVLVPAMIYLLGMPTDVVIGTSLFQVVFITAAVTILQAVLVQSVDVVLALILLIGGVLGAQYGVRLGARLAAEELRVLLALLVLAVAGKILYDLVATPSDLYSIAPYTVEPSPPR